MTTIADTALAIAQADGRTKPDNTDMFDAQVAADKARLNPAQPDGDNIAAAKSKLMDIVSVYGRQAARGTTSLTHLAFLFAESVRGKLLSELDAEAVYTTYVKAHNDAIAERHAVTGASPLEVSKASVSIFRSFGKPGPVAQADLYQRVLVLRNQVAADDLIGSSYNCFVAVNRAITKVIDEGKGLVSPDTLKVDDAFIVAAISKPAKPDKTAADKLAQVAAALQKLVKTGAFPGLENHYSELVAYHGRFVAGKVGPHAFMGASTVLGGVETGEQLSVH